MGADGSLYMLEWGRDFNYAGSGINPDSGLYRIEYAKGNRTPVAGAERGQGLRAGAAPGEFSSEGSEDPDGDDADVRVGLRRRHAGVDRAEPDAHLHRGGHVHRPADGDGRDRQVRHLDGRSSPSATRARRSSRAPEQGGIYDWGDEIRFRSRSPTPRTGRSTATGGRVPGHLPRRGRQRPRAPRREPDRLRGHDRGRRRSPATRRARTSRWSSRRRTRTTAAPGADPLTGADTGRLNPKQIQAEHFTASGVQLNDRAGRRGRPPRRLHRRGRLDRVRARSRWRASTR